MKIVLHNISIKELSSGYRDSGIDGVVGYGGKLDIRPPFQREFVYGEKERAAVIDTVLKGYPLNVMYWADKGYGNFEIIDGQQRTISVCQYISGEFSYKGKYFHSLSKPEQEKILNYELMIYFCEGDEAEKLEWFSVVNIAGKALTKQELRNAIYHGSWVSDAKRYFSKTGCVAFNKAGGYLKGSAIKQDYLETAISWACGSRNEDLICQYMSLHQHNTSAEPLWKYVENVIDWVQKVFTTYRKEMQGVEWGFLYNQYKDGDYNSEVIEKQVAELMEDEDVTQKSGIYEYILTGNQNVLNLRAFNDKIKREVFTRQNGICVKCQKQFKIEQMQADHITPWSKGGKTNTDNCQLLCSGCNARKSDKY